MTNHRVEWKSPQPTVDEALAFADLGLPAMEYSNSYGRALRALAAEVRRQRGALESAHDLIKRVTSKFDMDAIANGHGGPGVNVALRQWRKDYASNAAEPPADPIDPTNNQFRLCAKGHVAYSLSFDECPSCKIERGRNALNREHD